MKNISINNGRSYCTIEEALNRFNIRIIAHYMDDEIREEVHRELAPCTDAEFIKRYLELATEDLIIG